MERQGRKVTTIIFKLSSNDAYISYEEANKDILNKLKKYGVKEQQAQQLLKKHDKDYILANIAIVEEEINKRGDHIKDITRYLLKGFEVDYRPLETEFSKIQKIKSAEKKQKWERLEQQRQNLKEQKKFFTKWKQAKTEQLFNALPQEQQQVLKGEFENKMTNNPTLEKMYAAKGFRHPMIQGQRFTFLGEQLLSDDEKDFENYQQQAQSKTYANLTPLT